MRLQVFDLIDETLLLLEQNDTFYHEALGPQWKS